MSAEKKQPRKRANAAEATGHESITPATAASVPTIDTAGKPAESPRVFEFNGHPLSMLLRGGQVWCVAKQAGEALGYKDGSKLSENIGGDWADEFIEGTDFVRVTGKALAEIKSILSQPDSGESHYPPNRGVVDPRAKHLVLLSRSGLDMAATLARTKYGTKFRRWLIGTVLPAFRQEQALSTATEEQISRAVRVEMDRQFRTPESRHAELMRCAGNTGEAFARILGCDAGQARAAAIELAKGLVGYGGTGRELGYVSTRQFKAMRALLQGLPSFVALAPRKRRRQLVRVIESGDERSVQQVLPIFRAQADVGNAVVTVTVEQKKPEAA